MGFTLLEGGRHFAPGHQRNKPDAIDSSADELPVIIRIVSQQTGVSLDGTS